MRLFHEFNNITRRCGAVAAADALAL